MWYFISGVVVGIIIGVVGMAIEDYNRMVRNELDENINTDDLTHGRNREREQ